MACFTIEKLINDLKEKDNKIKGSVEEILHEYQEWKQKSKKLLQKENAEIAENTLIAKIMAASSIKKEVNNDNSDSAIADMLIKGISMGTIDMEKKIHAYNQDVNKEDLNMAKEYYNTALEELEESEFKIINNYYMMELIGTDTIEEKREKMNKVTKEEIVEVAKKVSLDTIFLLEGVKNEGN